MRKMFYFFILIILTLQTIAYNTIDPDYWARLLQGNYFLQHGSIMKTDIFSYTQTHEWIDHEWLSSIVFSFIQNNFGFSGILIFKTLLVFLIFLLIFKTIRLETEKNSTLLNILLFSAAVCAMPSITQSGLRCHFFTFLFFTLFIYILELVRKKGKTKLLFLLPPVMLIWFNMHGGCVSGFGLLFLYAAGEALNKKPFKHYIYTLAACAALMFINPYGIEYIKFVFSAALMSRPYVTEWISPFLHPDLSFMLWFKALFIFFAAVIIKNIKALKTDYTKLLILCACIIVSFKSVKSSPFFITASMIFIYEYIAAFIPEKLPKIINISAAAAIIAAGALSINKESFFFLSYQPYEVIEFMRINELKGKLLAPMEMGSYAAYKLYPDILIYMDGRYEEVYYKETKDRLNAFFNMEENRLDILEDKPDFIIIPADAAINETMLFRPDYKVIWTDERNWLYSIDEIVKPVYKRRSNDKNYYIKNAFKTGVI